MLRRLVENSINRQKLAYRCGPGHKRHIPGIKDLLEVIEVDYGNTKKKRSWDESIPIRKKRIAKPIQPPVQAPAIQESRPWWQQVWDFLRK